MLASSRTRLGSNVVAAVCVVNQRPCHVGARGARHTGTMGLSRSGTVGEDAVLRAAASSVAGAVGAQVLVGGVQRDRKLPGIPRGLSEHETALDRREGRGGKPVGLGAAVELAGLLHRVKAALQLRLPALECISERE